MADKKISDFTATTTLNDGDLFEVETVGGNSRKITAANVAAYIGSGYEAGPPTAPTTADFASWDYQGTSTATDGTGAMVINPQVDGVPHARVKAVPAAPFDIYCRVDWDCFSTAALSAAVQGQAGILLKDNADNERVTISCYVERISAGGDEQNTYAISVQRWTGASPPVFSAAPIAKYTLRQWEWLHVNVTSTTITVEASRDGKNWTQVGTETIATFIDAVTHYGPFALANSNATEAVAVFSYFSTTAPS